MKAFWRVFEWVTEVLPFLFVFVASMYLPTDPDLGWHLKYGEYFFKYGGVLRNNTFSTLMPNFKWANGQWGTDVLTYAAFHIGGFLGLTLVSALVVTLAFYFFAKVCRLGIAEKSLLFPLLIYLESPINSVSLRGQQISLTLIGVLCLTLSRYKASPKNLFWLPVLFLFWANIHEQFFMGFGILGVWIGITVIRDFIKKYGIASPFHGLAMTINRSEIKNAGYLIFIFVLSSLVTLINPFGWGIHVVALSHFASPLLKDIAEYLPFTFASQLWWNQIVIGILVVFGIIFLFFKEELLDSMPIILTAFLLIGLSFEVRRYAWPAYYMITPILAPLVAFVAPSSKRDKLYYGFVISTISLIFIVYFKWPMSSYSSANWNSYCRSGNTMCSPPSAEYLRKHKLTHNLFSLYGWGGWLIWNYQGLKPTIDGRMHLWREGVYSGFEDYYKFEQNMNDVDKSSYDIVYMPPGKPIYKRMYKLVREKKWKKVYEDKLAGIFVRL